jgi:hypothetical protein
MEIQNRSTAMKNFILTSSRILSPVIVSLFIGLFALAQELTISVENPSETGRHSEPVVISWPEIVDRIPAVSPDRLRLIDENNRSLAFQIDDMDGDGVPDEFTFTADFQPKQTRQFLLTGSADTLALPTGPYRTDAVNYKRIDGIARFVDDDDGPGTFRSDNLYPFDGVGWESEIVGYRLYLDERNAIDIQAKRIPGLHWRYIAESGANYQLDAYWGMDVLHVGPALGIGGIGFWTGDSIAHPFNVDRRHCRIIARGPVRAVVRVDYYGWELPDGKANVSSIFIIYGGDRISEHRILLNSPHPAGKTIAAGIVKHDPADAFWNPTEANLYTIGKQSRTNDSLLMTLTFDPSTVVQKTEDEYNHLVLLRLEQEHPVSFFISTVWEGETGSMWNDKDVKFFLMNTALRLTEPMRVNFR